ncbi:MAG: hypothetical protein QXM00_11395 [Candidatus Bathyarchaeia archaeon]
MKKPLFGALWNVEAWVVKAPTLEVEYSHSRAPSTSVSPHGLLHDQAVTQ